MTAIEDMLLKFTSGNDVAVQRAVVTLDEWRATYAEYMALQARVAELEAEKWNAQIAEAALLSVEKERDKWQEIANRWLAVSNDQTLACSHLREERDGLAAKCAELEQKNDQLMLAQFDHVGSGNRAVRRIKADAVREWLDGVVTMLVNSKEMTTHRGMTHVAIDHLREHLPQHESNQIEREGGA